MWRYQILPLLRFIALIFLIVGIITTIVFSIRGFVNFISVNPSPRLILQFIFYIVLILGFTGICRGIVDFFKLGDIYQRGDSFTLAYEKIVRQTADYLILFSGALLFIWLL